MPSAVRWTPGTVRSGVAPASHTSLDPVGGGRAHDGADVGRRAEAVEHQREPAGGAAPPLPVEPLQPGAVEGLHRPHLEHAGSPAARPAARTVQPSPASQAASESAPRCRCTTRWARPSSVEPAQPAQQQLVERGLADADRRVRPDRREPDVGGHLVGRDDPDVGEPGRGGVLGAQLRGPAR